MLGHLDLLGTRRHRLQLNRRITPQRRRLFRPEIRRVGLDHHQRRADRHLVADLARKLDHHARHRRFHLDRRLVGHHVGDLLVFLDPVPDRDVPRHDLGLGNTLANVGQLERKTRHYASFMIFLSASPMRTGPGKYAHSRLCGYGVSKPVTRSIGASRW